MLLLLFWGVILFTLVLGPLAVVGIVWSPFAALTLYLTMARRGYRGARYALLGSLYSISFFVPWVLAMLEDWNPKKAGVYTRFLYALLYTAWAMPMLFGLHGIANSDGTYWYGNYVKVWLPSAAVGWIGSLVYLIVSSPDSGDDDGLPRLHQVLPFALFAISIVCLLGPMFVAGLND